MVTGPLVWYAQYCRPNPPPKFTCPGVKIAYTVDASYVSAPELNPLWSIAIMSTSATICVPVGTLALLAQYCVYVTEFTIFLPKASVYEVLMLKYFDPP